MTGHAPSDALIIDALRTPIGRYGGVLAGVRPDDLAAHVIAAAVARNGIDGAQVEDVYFGDANQAGEDNRNVARMGALLAGLPVEVPGATVNRLCGSGLEAIASAARVIAAGEADICLAGGVESISLIQNEHSNKFRACDPWIMEMKPETYMAMLDTAEVVAQRYHISREAQDEYAIESQSRTAAAQVAGRFDAEIIPVTTKMAVMDRTTNDISYREVTITKDECNRPDTTLQGLASLKPVRDGGSITAGNALLPLTGT